MILLDCGLNVGNPRDLFPKFDNKSFNVHDLDAIILSHAHLEVGKDELCIVQEYVENRVTQLGEITQNEALFATTLNV